MTIKKMIDKYTKLMKLNYESVLITEILNDLWQIKRQNDLRIAKRKRLI